MQLPQPYIHTSERMVAIIDRAQMAPWEGIVSDAIFGYHTFWAVEVPFIPVQVEEEGKKDAAERFQQMMQRQQRFLYDLAQSREHQATFEMRLIARPQANGPTRVGIAFLGKTFDVDAKISRQAALGLWDKFSALFPREAPFSYPLLPVEQYETRDDRAAYGFKDWFLPLPLQKLSDSQTIVELRKYEDWPTIRDVGGVLRTRDYIPHSFIPASDHTALARLFGTLARQQQIAIVAMTLRPQQLTDQEVVLLHEFAGWYRRASERTEDVEEAEKGKGGPLPPDRLHVNNRYIKRWRELNSGSVCAYQETRAEVGRKLYNELIREHHSLFLVRLQVIGIPVAPDDVIEALGSTIGLDLEAEKAHGGRWSRMVPQSPDELYWAGFNAQWLEFARWGISRIIQVDRRLLRFRQLASISEAAGVFALPLGIGAGNLAGIEVRNEPFPLPVTLPVEHDARCVLGKILDRGIPTAFSLSLAPSLRAHLLQIFGSTGASRDHLIYTLFAARTDQPRIFLSMDNTNGRALAERLFARYIALDSKAPEGTLACFPFLPPPGVALSRFIDALLRVLLVICALDASATPFLRQVLTEVYHRLGWTKSDVDQPRDLAVLAAEIDVVAQQQKGFPSRVTIALRQRCAPLLRDLALTAGHLFRSTPASPMALEESQVITIGWLWGESNSVLLAGCLWAWYALALTEQAGRAEATEPAGVPRGLLGLAGAHSLLAAPAGSGISPLASLLSSATRAGVGLVLVDDRPDLLDPEIAREAGATLVLPNTMLSAQEHLAALLGVSTSQRGRLTQLSEGEAVVQIRDVDPVHIKVGL
jgi:hypothetical protein